METVLTTLPASTETERLVLMMVADAGASHVELRQQSFSAGIGWFTQSTVRMEPGQVAALRNALGLTGGRTTNQRLPREFSTVTPAAWQPRVVHADSA